MSAPTWFVGEFGTVFEADAGREVSSVSSAAILFKKPSGETVSRTATQGSSTRYWQYTVASDHFDESGTWTAQVQLTLSTPGFVAGSLHKFEVGAVLEAS